MKKVSVLVALLSVVPMSVFAADLGPYSEPHVIPAPPQAPQIVEQYVDEPVIIQRRVVRRPIIVEDYDDAYTVAPYVPYALGAIVGGLAYGGYRSYGGGHRSYGYGQHMAPYRGYGGGYRGGFGGQRGGYGGRGHR